MSWPPFSMLGFHQWSSSLQCLKTQHLITFKQHSMQSITWSTWIFFFDVIWQTDKGCATLKKWFWLHAIDLVCNIVCEELESAKPQLWMSAKDATPDFILTWDINSLMGHVRINQTSVWSQILEAPMETQKSKGDDKNSKSPNHQTVSLITI